MADYARVGKDSYKLSKEQRISAKKVAIGHLVACYFHTVAFLTWLVVGLIAIYSDPEDGSTERSVLNITLEVDEETQLPSYDLFWTAVWVPLIAAVFHGLQYATFVRLFERQKASSFKNPEFKGKGWGWYPFLIGTVLAAFLCLCLGTKKSTYAYSSIVYGINLIRWIEYSISASFVTWNVVEIGRAHV